MNKLIKHSVFWFSLLYSLSAMAQAPLRVRHAGELFLIEQNTDVKIKGGLESLDGNNTNKVINLGDLYVSDSIVNKGGVYIFGSLPDTLGHVYLDGHKKQKFGGKAIYFSNLTLNNSADTLFIHKDTVYITKKLNFTKGKINVDKGVLHLKRTPYLWGTLNGTIQKEDTASHIFGYPGYIKIDRPLTLGQSYSNLHGTGLDLTVSGNLGSRTEIRRYHRQQLKVSNGSNNWYFSLYPKLNDDISNVSMTYLDTTGLNGNEKEKLAIYYSTDDGLGWRDLPSTVDTNLNKVSSSKRITVNNKTRITLSEDSCDVLPYVNIRQDTFPLCSGTSIYISADSIGDLDVSWSNSVTGVDSILVNSPGMYWVKVVSDGGCVNYDTCYVISAPDPQPGFYAAPHCLGDSAFFNDTSSISSGSISYQWNFGDPFSTHDTSTQKTPKYLYTKFGTFNAQVELTSNYGCKKSFTRSVVVLPIPQPAFTAPNHCADTSIQFTNTSSVPGGAGLSYLWKFGDGDTSVLTNPTHAYARDTIFEVKLVASSQGCTDSTSKFLTIYPNPEPQFYFNNPCPNEVVDFIDSSKINSGSMSYKYTFGNGKSSTLTQPNTTYTIPGNYTVELELLSDKNCRAVYSDTIVVNPRPLPSFVVQNACLGDSARFINNSTIASGTFNSHWKFGDGDTSNANNPTHAYASQGSFTAKLILTSDSSCVDSVSNSLTVYAKPKAGFSTSLACLNKSVSFTNSSTINSGNLTYKWYFGNGDSSSVKSPITSYATAGLKNVLLIARSANGCTDSANQSVSVFANPSLNFGSITTCGNSLELDAGNPGSQYQWSNGKRSQKITASASGSYAVTVTNTNQCHTSDTAIVTLNRPVKPLLGPDKTVCDSVELTTGYGATASTALWNNSATSHSLTVTSSGIYSVTVTDPNNCVGSDTIVVTVNSSPSLELGRDISRCADSLVTLSSNVSVPNYKWSTGATAPQISVNKSGKYVLTVTDANSCSDTDEVLVSISPLPVVDLGNDRSACDSTTLKIDPAGANLLWKNGSTGSSILLTSSDTVWVTATSSQNCTTTDTVAITINSSPKPNLGSDTTVCFGETVKLDAGYPSSKYNWSTTDTTQTIEVYSSQTVQLSVTDTNGCRGADTIKVKINPELVVDLGVDQTLCANSSKVLSVGFSDGTFSWNSNNGFSSSLPSVQVNDTGMYWVEAIDTSGCSASDTIRLLYTNKEIHAEFTSVDEALTGDTVAFINLSYPKPDNSLWEMHDGYTSKNLHAFYPYFIPGTYQVKLMVSNSLCSDTLVKDITIKLRTRKEVYESSELTAHVFVEKLHLYPNPTQGTLYVEVELSNKGEVVLEMFDLYGHLITIEPLVGQEFKRTYELSTLKPGMYFIRTTSGKSSMTKKFIKVN